MEVEALSLFWRLMLLLFSLVVIGEPLRVLFTRYVGLFGDLDRLQIVVIDVYLGGFLLYAVASIPLPLFSALMTWCILIIAGALSFSLHFKSLKNLCKKAETGKEYLVKRKNVIVKYVIVITMFLSLLWVEVLPLSNFVYGSVHDTALFGLFVELILENQYIPATIRPYGTEGIIYPQGFFVMEAFACHTLGFSAAEVAFRVTPLFMALSVLGAYFLGKALSPSSHLDISLAFTFWCISRWPRLLFWGSNAFVAGFPLFFIALSILPQLKELRLSGQRLAKAIAIGLLFGYLASVHLVFFQLLFVLVALRTIFFLLKERRYQRRTLFIFLVFCVFSVIPISVSIYRFIAWYPYPGNNVGLPDDIVLPDEGYVGGIPAVTVLGQLYEWIIVSDWMNPDPLIKSMIVSLFAVGAFVIVLTRKDEHLHYLQRISMGALSSSAVAALMIVLVTREASTFFPFVHPLIVKMVQVAQTTILLLTSLFILVAIYNVALLHVCQNLYAHLSLSGDVTRSSPDKCKLQGNRTRRKKTIVLRAATIVVLILLPFYAPFVLRLFTSDLNYAYGQYNMFCVTTENDDQLMLQMKGSLPANAVILVNPNGAGGFIPSVSNRRVVFQPGASRLSRSYIELVDRLDNHDLSIATYELMDQFNVTHLFIGSRAIFGHTPWDPNLFINNPNFELLLNMGGAYLFAVNLGDFDSSILCSHATTKRPLSQRINAFVGQKLVGLP